VVIRRSLLALMAATILAGCDPGMDRGKRLKPYEATPQVADMRSAWPLPPDTVPYGSELYDEAFRTGLDESGVHAERFPFVVTPEILARGHERYRIFCSTCHGITGKGDGPVVRHGFPVPHSFHDREMMEMSPAQIVQVIVFGDGPMPTYAARVTPPDRWAIAAYVLAMQGRRHPDLGGISEDVLRLYEVREVSPPAPPLVSPEQPW
jgi:hypothetical protein